jgi:hypothetical protein
MKIRRISATPINLPMEGHFGSVFGKLPGFTQTIGEVASDERACRVRQGCGAQGSPLARP